MRTGLLSLALLVSLAANAWFFVTRRAPGEPLVRSPAQTESAADSLAPRPAADEDDAAPAPPEAEVEVEVASQARRTSPAESRATRDAAERQLDEETRRMLGEAGYTEMKEANDQTLQQTREFTRTLNLPPTTAAELVAVQKEFSPRISEQDRNRDLTPNERDAQVAALGHEARDRLVRLLGPANFETYKRRGGGWLGSALGRAPPR